MNYDQRASRESFWEAWQRHPFLWSNSLQDDRKAFKKAYPRILEAFVAHLPAGDPTLVILDLRGARNRAITRVLAEKYGITGA